MSLNRAEMIRAAAACDALGSALRAAIKAAARADFEEQGTAPTYRMPGYTVSTSITHDGIEVVDEQLWLEFVTRRWPGEVETVRRVRSSWQSVYFAAVLGRGDPPCDDEGTVLPGLAYRRGGEFRSVSVLPDAQTKWLLRKTAAEIASGVRPLELPTADESREGSR